MGFSFILILQFVIRDWNCKCFDNDSCFQQIADSRKLDIDAFYALDVCF